MVELFVDARGDSDTRLIWACFTRALFFFSPTSSLPPLESPWRLVVEKKSRTSRLLYIRSYAQASILGSLILCSSFPSLMQFCLPIECRLVHEIDALFSVVYLYDLTKPIIQCLSAISIRREAERAGLVNPHLAGSRCHLSA